MGTVPYFLMKWKVQILASSGNIFTSCYYVWAVCLHKSKPDSDVTGLFSWKDNSTALQYQNAFVCICNFAKLKHLSRLKLWYHYSKQLIVTPVTKTTVIPGSCNIATIFTQTPSPDWRCNWISSPILSPAFPWHFITLTNFSLTTQRFITMMQST